MTPSIVRSEINRANAQHSTGPKTDEGKKRSSLNAMRHGLTSQVIVLPNEDPQAYHAHLTSFLEEYKPQGPTESQLVQTLADTAWRMNRASALETNLLTLGMIKAPTQVLGADEAIEQAMSIAASLDAQSRALNTLSLHGQRLYRQFEKILSKIQELQSARQLKEKKQLSPTGFVLHEPRPQEAGRAETPTNPTPTRDHAEVNVTAQHKMTA